MFHVCTASKECVQPSCDYFVCKVRGQPQPLKKKNPCVLYDLYYSREPVLKIKSAQTVALFVQFRACFLRLQCFCMQVRTVRLPLKMPFPKNWIYNHTRMVVCVRARLSRHTGSALWSEEYCRLEGSAIGPSSASRGAKVLVSCCMISSIAMSSDISRRTRDSFRMLSQMRYTCTVLDVPALAAPAASQFLQQMSSLLCSMWNKHV
jgi:hypothetical protein